MRVGIDARALNTSHLRGMGKALLATLEEIAARDEGVELVLFADEPRHPLMRPRSGRVEQRVWEVRGHRFRAWEQIGLPLAARRLGCDVLHATGTWAPWWQPVPTVVTIHDTIPWDGDGTELPLSRAFLETVQPRAYGKARVILTPSASSRDDIARRWPSLAPKVRVVPWGIAEVYTRDTIPALDPAIAAMGVRPPYLLYFGGHLERKRLAWAMEVWDRASTPDVQLVVCGLPTDQVREWTARAPEARRHMFLPLGFVDEASMPGLYAQSTAVIYPTMYEGFGFPALEAQSVGRPVLMSAVSSLRELAGPGAVVLPPHDMDAWVDACRRIVSAPPGTDPVARTWARAFSWGAVADAMLSAYRTAAGRSHA